MKCSLVVIVSFMFAGLSNSNIIPAAVKIESKQRDLEIISKGDTLIFAQVVSEKPEEYDKFILENQCNKLWTRTLLDLSSLQLYRHGDRNIKKPYKNDPNKDEMDWPGGFGQLTNVCFILIPSGIINKFSRSCHLFDHIPYRKGSGNFSI